MTVDADIHFWKFHKAMQAPLIRGEKKMQEDMLPETVRLSLQRNGIESCVAVAAEATEVETRFLAELMRTHPIIRGVVAWIDLMQKDSVKKLEKLTEAYPEIRGFRTVFSGGSVLPDPVMAVLAERFCTLDIDLAGGVEAPAIRNQAEKWPDQVFILSRCGSPDVKQPPTAAWTAIIKALASCANVHCKVSGLFTQAAWNKWRPADFYPFLETLFSAFGPGRLLFGSDWPFIQLSGAYVQWKSLLDKFTGHLSEDDRNDFYGGNATKLYRL